MYFRTYASGAFCAFGPRVSGHIGLGPSTCTVRVRNRRIPQTWIVKLKPIKYRFFWSAFTHSQRGEGTPLEGGGWGPSEVERWVKYVDQHQQRWLWNTAHWGVSSTAKLFAPDCCNLPQNRSPSQSHCSVKYEHTDMTHIYLHTTGKRCPLQHHNFSSVSSQYSSDICVTCC